MDNNISSHTKKYDTDDIIFLEFEKGDKFYMVQSGSVKIMKVIKDVEKLLNIVYPGDFLERWQFWKALQEALRQ